MHVVPRITRATGTLPPDGVRAMFDRIAPVYDAMNRVFTMGLDGRWRKLAAAAVVTPGDRVLDAACGTGDLAIAARGAGGKVTGLDFSERMLERARRKSESASSGCKGMRSRCRSTTRRFDAATIGFGIRNVDDLDAGLRELARVVRPGGRLAVLEITRPARCLAPVLPALVRRAHPAGRQGAPRRRRLHATCPRACVAFPAPTTWPTRFERAGFADVSYRLLAGGIVSLHVGRR